MKYAVIALIACVCYASERKITKKTLGIMGGLLVLAYLMGIWGKEGISTECPWYSSPCADCPKECGWFFGLGCLFEDCMVGMVGISADDKCSDPAYKCSGDNHCIKKGTDVCGGQTEEQCQEDGDTWCGGDGAATCQDKMTELCAPARANSAGECDACMGSHQKELRDAGCSAPAVAAFCAGGGGGGGICDINTYIVNFPSPSASNVPLPGGSTEIVIQNKTGEDCYVYGDGGTGEDNWKHMGLLTNNTDTTYYLNNKEDRWGASFGLFNSSVGLCDDGLANKSLFEITTSANYPSMDISFNAGFNYGVQFVANASDGNSFRRCAKNILSPSAYGNKDKSSCQVQPCAAANDVVDYDIYPAKNLHYNFADGNIKKVIVTFFKEGDASYNDTNGPCGTQQCPGVECDQHPYNIPGDIDICQTSGSSIYCWGDYDPTTFTDPDVPICPKCEYLKQPGGDQFKGDWTGCDSLT